MAYRTRRRSTRAAPRRTRSSYNRRGAARSSARKSSRRVSRSPRQQTVRVVIQTTPMGSPVNHQVSQSPLRARF